MNYLELKKNLAEFAKIKNSLALDVIDAHVHPLDVMGICENKISDSMQSSSLSPNISESLNYNWLSILGTRLVTKYLNNSSINVIKKIYNRNTEKLLLDQIHNSLVDKAILLPIEPWCRTKNIIANYNSKSFFHLISVDIHDIEIDDLISHLENLLKASSVIGIKLHPNLQNFFPIPSMNNYEIEKKLELIYHFASTNKLFILFHAGLSFFQKEVFSGAKVIARSHSKALLRNFINRDGRIEIIEKFDLKIIFAHLGHYGFGHVDTDLIRKISENYTNVYFDTSGQSPKSILKTLQSIGSRRIIFGSDSLYNKMAYNLVFAYKAINMVYNHCECREKAIMNIFQNNIIQLIRNK